MNKMSKYTPGPWNLGRSGNDGESYSVHSFVVERESNKQIGWVADSWNDSKGKPYISEEDKANARLITQAPGLLKYLLEAVEFVQDDLDDAHHPIEECDCDRCTWLAGALDVIANIL